MFTLQNIILAATAITTALMAGLFFAFSCSVMPGLHKLTDSEFIAAMQSINKAIQNPLFFLVFFGVLVLLPVSVFVNYHKPLPVRFWMLLAATIIYFIGVFAVSAAGNIPLNNSLDKFDLLQASKEVIAMQRAAFETKWNSLNTIRTVASAVSLILVIIACIKKNN